MQKENREQKSKIYTSSQEWYMDNNDELLQAIYELLKSVLQLHKPTNNICDIELLTSRGSLRFEYVYDILSYLESRLNIKINYMTVSRYDMLTVGTLTKFLKKVEGNILKKSRFIIFLKEIYTKDKFSCWLSVCMMLLSTFFVIFLPKLLQYIIDESMRGQQIKYILFFGGLYFLLACLIH